MLFFYKKFHMQERSGFTLIEFLVAFSLFVIILSISVGGFIRALRIQRQLVGLASANSNVSLALEQMAREIRNGIDFQCNAECDNLTFHNLQGDTIAYQLFSDGEKTTIQRSESCVQPSPGCTGGDYEDITGTNVRINYLRFTLGPTTSASRVTLMVGLSSKESGIETTTVWLQTTVSARN
jgi:prepilin-type N-terminal cleavage/methylation domain-containing protein